MASLNPISGPLGIQRASHLLRRTSFRYTRSRIDELAALSAEDALNLLLAANPLQHEQPLYAASPSAQPVTWINPPLPPSAPLPADDGLLTRYVIAWWANEALHDPGIVHRMTFFFHQYLAVSADSGSSSEFFDYLALLRWGALGNFKKLVTKMIVDNCMLRYIDNDQNYKNNPNENFAREFFELHTIGAGLPAGPGDYTNYTEDDIVAAARVLTGFNHALRNVYVDPETSIPAGRGYPQSHDFQPKTFSARFDNMILEPVGNDEAAMVAELNAFIDMVFAKEETSRHFCRRLYRFFVTRAIPAEVETDIIGGLVQTLQDNNFDILPVLRQLFASEHFYDQDDSNADDEIRGALIKSPIDLVFQTLNFFNAPIPSAVTDNIKHYIEFYNSSVIERMLGNAGIYLFYPPDVAGYQGYFQEPGFNRGFFNTATIIQRYKLPEILISGTQVLNPNPDAPIGTKVDLPAWIRDHSGIFDAADPQILVDELLRYLLPEPPSAARFDYFYNTIFLNNLPAGDWSYEWQNYLSSGNADEVSIPLARLFTAILYAPEYQVM